VKWRKHGVVWRPDGTLPWARSHATCPTPMALRDGRLRLFLQCRDAGNVGRVGWVDVDPDDPRRVIATARDPVLDIGRPGAFDDNGVFPTAVLRGPDGRLWMYYVGFELCHHIRYRLLTGLAFSDDEGESFHRYADVPVLERSSAEPHFRCGPCVQHEDGRFRMWYVAGGTWETIEGKPMPIYDIRLIESADGLTWPAVGQVVLEVTAAEHGFGRPYVLRDARGYRMHYSIRRRQPARYRLGYATSPDGIHWARRDDEIGLDVTPGDWDGDAIEYGAAIHAGGHDWLLYNGDDFGATGFGVAQRIQ
jgi:predicted GH43/DUF377 family glycosyl hydrolase